MFGIYGKFPVCVYIYNYIYIYIVFFCFYPILMNFCCTCAYSRPSFFGWSFTWHIHLRWSPYSLLSSFELILGFSRGFPKGCHDWKRIFQHTLGTYPRPPWPRVYVWGFLNHLGVKGDSWGMRNKGMLGVLLEWYVFSTGFVARQLRKCPQKFRPWKPKKKHSSKGDKLTNPSQSIHGNGIFTYIEHKYQPNVGKYTIHGWYGLRTCLCVIANCRLKDPRIVV